MGPYLGYQDAVASGDGALLYENSSACPPFGAKVHEQGAYPSAHFLSPNASIALTD